MIKRAVTAAAVLTAAATSTQAQGFSGGELGAEFFVIGDNDDLGYTAYQGSGEVNLMPAFSVAGDIVNYRYNNITSGATTGTLHGIFHYDSATSFGVFLGQDRADGARSEFYGIEAGSEMFGIAFEGYLGAQDGATDAVFLGGAGSFDLARQFSVTGEFGYVDLNGGDALTRLSGGVEYALDRGPALYGELGRIGGDDGSSSFVGFGARLDFGPQAGTTFGRRGVNDIIADR